MRQPVIIFQGISKNFGNNRILNSIFLTINHGEKCLLRGKNGSGKTTFLKIAARLLYPDEGNIIYRGQNLYAIKKFQNRFPSYLTDQIDYYPHLTVKEWIYINNKIIKDFNIDLINKKFFMEKYQNYLIKNLSYGIKKRLFLSSVLARNSDLFLLDEPFKGLDKNFIDIAQEYIFSLSEKTFIIASHEINSYQNYNQMIEIISGKIHIMEKRNFPVFISTKPFKEDLLSQLNIQEWDNMLKIIKNQNCVSLQFRIENNHIKIGRLISMLIQQGIHVNEIKDESI